MQMQGSAWCWKISDARHSLVHRCFASSCMPSLGAYTEHVFCKHLPAPKALHSILMALAEVRGVQGADSWPGSASFGADDCSALLKDLS